MKPLLIRFKGRKEDLLEQLKALAEKEGESMNNIAVTAIEKHLKKNK